MIRSTASRHDPFRMLPDAAPESVASVAAPRAHVNRDRDVAVRTMLERHFSFVYRTLRRLGVPASDVQDAAQQVFMITSDNFDRILPGKQRAFVLGVALRVAANARRAAGSCRTMANSKAVDAHIDPAPDAEELLDRKRTREALDGALESLSLELRTVFVLFEFEELSSPEIADLLELPVGTVASRLRRARQRFLIEVERLRTQLKPEGGG